jgi:hypothetical protein
MSPRPKAACLFNLSSSQYSFTTAITAVIIGESARGIKYFSWTTKGGIYLENMTSRITSRYELSEYSENVQSQT